MAFNPLKAIVDLAGKIGGGVNEGLTELKYGPNYRDQVDFLTRKRDLDMARSQADLENVQATTGLHRAQADIAANPDPFSVFSKSKTPMMLTTADAPQAIPGPAGTNTFFRPLSLDEQAKQVGAVTAAKNTVGGEDIRAKSLQQKYDALAARAKTQQDLQTIRLAHQTELKQMGIDAALAKPYKLSTVDAQGIPQDVLTTVGGASTMARGAGPQGAVIDKPLTGMNASRAIAAQAALSSETAIQDELQKPEVRAGLGALAGRITSVEQLLGTTDPALQHLRGMLHGYALNTMGVHGMRSATEAHHLMDEMFGYKFDPDTLAAGLHGLNEVPRFYAGIGRKQSAPKVQNGTGAGAAAAATSAPGAFDVNAFIKSGYGKGTP